MMKRRRHDFEAGRRILPVELTPMIDVIFLLIIFFMATAQFARLTRAELDLPQERGEQKAPEEAGLVINILRGGEIIVHEREVGLDEFAAMIEQEVHTLPGRNPQRLKVLLRADREADTASLNRVVARLQGTGVAAARIASEVPR
jgi:biopolymer transport protein ExbD